MSKKNISKISLWILIFSILSLVTVAMVWSPRKELKIRGNADNLLERYDTSDIIEYSGCYINQSGQICINGVDPHIVFKKENIKNVTTIVDKTAAGPPTLASAAFPTKRPTMIVSTVVYNCWINVPSMIGKKKINSCFQITPSVIAFFSIVFFPIFLSLSCIFHIFCFFSM